MDSKAITGIGVAVVVVLSLPLLLSSKVSMKNYNKIQMGMSYAQVKDILGKGMGREEVMKKVEKEMEKYEGKEMEMPSMDGVKMPQFKPEDFARMDTQKMMEIMTTSEPYVWERGEDKGISVMFQNDRVVMKSQYGLENSMTMDMEGMATIHVPLAAQ